METIDKFADVAAARARLLRDNPAGFFLSAMMAGVYVGLGIILIFSLGAEVDPSMRRLVMGASFGIALTLVIFAGSDLFTGLTMSMTHGWLRGRTSLGDLGRVWGVSWLGNFAGAVLVAVLFAAAGGGAILYGKSTLLFDVATLKMTAPPLALFARGILCNWLVCLAVWMSMRMTGDAAKCIAIFWCLFAFIASGYEHSVANMTVLVMALLGNAPPTVTIGGLAYNLLWVTLGNIVSGAGFMGLGYWLVARSTSRAAAVAAVGMARTA